MSNVVSSCGNRFQCYCDHTKTEKESNIICCCGMCVCRSEGEDEIRTLFFKDTWFGCSVKKKIMILSFTLDQFVKL